MSMVSDCCGAWTDADYGICSRCGEHCEAVADDSMVAPVTDDAWLDMAVGFPGETDFDG